MLILHVIDNGLACNCGVCRVLADFARNIVLKNGLYYLVYYILRKTIEGYSDSIPSLTFNTI